MFNDLLNEYLERFGKNIPFSMRNLSEDELSKLIRDALDKGIPLEDDLNPLKALY